MSTDLRNLFGTVVHNVPEGTTPIELRQFFGTVVHTTASAPTPDTIPCIEGPAIETNNYFGSGFVINNYKNLSSGRDRRVDQVPFKLGIKDRLGLRLDNTIATPSGSTPTYCDE
jgi:hypothetical protein